MNPEEPSNNNELSLPSVSTGTYPMDSWVQFCSLPLPLLVCVNVSPSKEKRRTSIFLDQAWPDRAKASEKQTENEGKNERRKVQKEYEKQKGLSTRLSLVRVNEAIRGRYKKDRKRNAR